MTHEWIEGLPSAEQAREHEKEHGGYWVVRQPTLAPQIVKLSAGLVVWIGAQVWQAALYPAEARYFPVGRDGLPVCALLAPRTWTDLVREIEAVKPPLIACTPGSPCAQDETCAAHRAQRNLDLIAIKAELLGRRLRELLTITYCSYCGRQEHVAGLTDEERREAMLEHILKECRAVVDIAGRVEGQMPKPEMGN
jgi:hypothetical protein